MDEEDGGGAAARMNVEEVLTKPVHSPSGVHKDLHGERAARVSNEIPTERLLYKCMLDFR